MDTENKNELKVYMFGKFQVVGMNGELGITHRCSKRIIKLMAFIFSHHTENLPILKIADAIYADEEIADPVAATRNLIWRLREAFKKEWGGWKRFPFNKGKRLPVECRNFIVPGYGTNGAP